MKYISLSDNLITPNLAASLISAFDAAYDMASFAAETTDFLGGNLKNQILPYLRNWAVEEELFRRSDAGVLPFHAKYVLNSRRNHKHLELEYNGFVITVSQTHNASDLPRECIFRNEHSLDGQLAISDFDVEDNEKAQIYAILTHGYASRHPSHILCGIPSTNLRSWDQLINLYKIASNISIVDPSPIDDEIKLNYRESAKNRLAQAHGGL